MYSPAARWVEAVLRAAAYATALAMFSRLGLGFLGYGPPLSAGEIIRGMAAGALLPYAAAAALRRSRRVQLTLEDERLILRGRPGSAELERGALDGLLAWRFPLPAPGYRLLLKSGGHLDLLLPARAARPLGASESGARERLALAWPTRSARGALLKFGLFPLVPALVVFRAYQVIGYGGLWGEYHFYGLGRWAFSLFAHWATTLAVVAAWAAVLRLAAEAASLLGALSGQRAAFIVRRWAEVAAGLAYYLAVPAALALMFLR